MANIPGPQPDIVCCPVFQSEQGIFLVMRWQALDILRPTGRYLLTPTHMSAVVAITVLKSIKIGRGKTYVPQFR